MIKFIKKYAKAWWNSYMEMCEKCIGITNNTSTFIY